MKETKKSLKIYFYVIGAFTLYAGYSAYTTYENPVAIISLLLGSAFIYLGVKMDYFVKNKTAVLINFVIFNFVINSLAFIMLKNFTSLIISIAISLYLINNIKRLSKENKIV